MMCILLIAAAGCVSFSTRNATRVSTAEDLVRAIGPNRTIILDPGEYVITGLPQSSRAHVTWEEVHDGDQIVVCNVSGLRICTEGGKPASILVSPRYAYVLSFRDCKDVSLENILFGHTKEKGYCTGGVLSFARCENVVIRNSILHGSGHEGLTVADSSNVTFADSIIRDCTYGIMSLSKSSQIVFLKSQFIDNQIFDLISIRRCEDVTFRECEIRRNRAGSEGEDTDHPLFSVSSSSRVTVRDSIIRDNEVDYLLHRKGTLDFIGCDIGENMFREARYKHAPE